MPISTPANLADSNAVYISAMQSAAGTAVTNLNTYASSWTNTTISAISPAVTLGTYPTGEVALLPTYTPIDFTPVTIPTLPDAPSLTGGTTPLWNETYWSNLKTLITNFTGSVTSSTNLDTVITNLTTDQGKLNTAMYAADLERKQQALRDAYSAANSATGAKGFTFPNSMSNALKMDAQQKFQFDLSQTARDLIKGIFEWAKSNWQFTISQGVSAHNSDAEFNTRYLSAITQAYANTLNGLLSIYKTETDVLMLQVDTKVKEYNFYLEKIKVKAEIVNIEDKAKLAKFAEDIKNAATAAEITLKANHDNAANKIAAGTAIMQGASSIAASTSNIAIGMLPTA